MQACHLTCKPLQASQPGRPYECGCEALAAVAGAGGCSSNSATPALRAAWHTTSLCSHQAVCCCLVPVLLAQHSCTTPVSSQSMLRSCASLRIQRSYRHVHCTCVQPQKHRMSAERGTSLYTTYTAAELTLAHGALDVAHDEAILIIKELHAHLGHLQIEGSYIF